MKFPVGSVSGKNAGALEGGVIDETPRDVKEEVLVDGAIGCSARIKVMDTPTTDIPAVCACLESECDALSLGPLLAAPGKWLHAATG